MAETPFLSSEQATSSLPYRPLSGLAVAAFGLAIGYSALVVVLGSIAYVTRAPLLGLWTLLVPITAAVLALVGRRRIRRSEGTLAGAALATWAWWLSLLFGFGYAAYYVGDYVAVGYQANTFVQEWVRKIDQKKVSAAFLDTLDPLVRQGMNPDDERMMRLRFGIASEETSKGPLGAFEDSELVRLVRNAGEPVSAEWLGSKSWEYKDGGYVIRATYRLTTPEGSFDALIPVRSMESKQFTGRRWSVIWNECSFVGTHALTPLGETLRQWLRPARTFLTDWIEKRNQGKLVAAYLDTMDPDQREQLDGEFRTRSRILLAAGAAAPAEMGPGLTPALTRIGLVAAPAMQRGLVLPGYADFIAGNLIQTAGFQANGTWREEIPQKIKELFADPRRLVIKKPQSEEPFPIRLGDQRIEVLQDVNLITYPPGRGGVRAEFQADARLVCQSDAGPIVADREPRWRVVRIELVRGAVPPALRNSGFGPPPAE